LLHVAAPATLKRPAGHTPTAGVALLEPGTQKKPALQLEHALAPTCEYVPAGQMLAAGVLLLEPAGHA
jgi:hypothetical protein